MTSTAELITRYARNSVTTQNQPFSLVRGRLQGLQGGRMTLNLASMISGFMAENYPDGEG